VPLTRDNAWALLNEYTKGESLLKHALAVEAAVGGVARKQGVNEDEWGVFGIIVE
jgi:predicted hydrolase (HD superfamily)